MLFLLLGQKKQKQNKKAATLKKHTHTQIYLILVIIKLQYVFTNQTNWERREQKIGMKKGQSILKWYQKAINLVRLCFAEF